MSHETLTVKLLLDHEHVEATSNQIELANTTKLLTHRY